MYLSGPKGNVYGSFVTPFDIFILTLSDLWVFRFNPFATQYFNLR